MSTIMGKRHWARAVRDVAETQPSHIADMCKRMIAEKQDSPMTPITERLRFHGRYASETQDECSVRKNAERTEAAGLIDELVAVIEAMGDDAVCDCTFNERRSAALAKAKGKQA